MIQRKAERFGPKLALSLYGDGGSEQYSYAELDAASGRLAAGLIDLGLKAGDRIALLCESRPRWGVAFFAAIRSGAIIVPLDTRQTPAELAATIADAEPRFLLLSRSQEGVCESLHDGLRDTRVLSIEAAATASAYPSIDAISARESRPCVERTADDVAVLTYTSGTMGTSKGVATTLGNLLYQIRAFREVKLNDSHVATVSILPLSHLFELTAGFLGVLYGGGSICYCNSLMPQEIVAAMQQRKITCMTTVPLILKLFADAIRREVGKQGWWKRLMFTGMCRVAAFLPLAARRRLFSKLHSRFGGRLEHFVCGGAPLDRATAQFFECVGLPVYQGYGLAETSPVVATNGPVANRSGSVGKPLPGVEVRIAENGEILTRGPQVMPGYFGQPELTASVIDSDGWLHTGDIGYFDKDGFLYISGRQKNVIVLGSGKKVQPEELEAVLFQHPFIAEGCVVGRTNDVGLTKDTEEVCAIAVATEAAIEYCATHAQNLGEYIRQLIEQQALSVAPCKRPTRIYLRSEPLPRTATRKVRRPEVCRWISGQGALI
jgi:long-chain acyl-CoA synthetase